MSTYPDTPGWKRDGTSSDAATAITSRAPTLRSKVLQVLNSADLTADECAERLGESVLGIRPRLSELRRAGKIEETGERRLNVSGMNASVWRATAMSEEVFTDILEDEPITDCEQIGSKLVVGDTPRTDAELIPNADLSDWGCGNSTMVRAEFARELEREVTAANDLEKKLRRALWAVAHCDDLRIMGEDDGPEIYRRLRYAVSGAEKALEGTSSYEKIR